MLMTDAASRFPELVERLEATVDPAKPFLVGAGGTLTYGALFDRLRRLAGVFGENGLQVGDRVVIVSRDDDHVITFLLALIRCGIGAVILDPQAPPEELAGLTRAAAPRGLVIDRDLMERSTPRDFLPADAWLLPLEAAESGALARLGRWLGRGASGYPAMLQGRRPAEPPALIPGRTPALILFTSGTTSRPKGVELTHRNLYAHLDTLVRQYGYGGDTRILNPLPLHHTDGINQGPTVALFAGATVYRPGPFTIPSLPTTADWLRRHRITHYVGTPTILALILRLSGAEAGLFATRDFRFVISMSGFLYEKLWRSFEERFGVRVVDVYGLTETVSGSLYCGPDDATRRLGTVGKPVDCLIRLVDEAGRDVPPGGQGELLLKGDHVMPGYFRNPEATAAVLKDGWLYTGDLATRDEDGFVAIVGRKKNVIIRGGTNVHPEKVTSALKSHLDVVDACTFGVADDIWGERVVACVIPVPGREPSPRNLIDHCRGKIAPESLPAEIYRFEEFPRGPAGKVVIARLKEMAAARHVETRVRRAPEDLGWRVRRIAAACFKAHPEELPPDATPEDTAGWDSYAHMELVTALETEFGIRLAPKDIMTMGSLVEVERIVHDKLAG